MEPMTWIALAGLAAQLLGGMGGGDKKQSGGPPMQFSSPAAFNPTPMSVGGADPSMTAKALGGQLGIMGQPPDFGDFDNDRMADVLRRGETIYG